MQNKEKYHAVTIVILNHKNKHCKSIKQNYSYLKGRAGLSEFILQLGKVRSLLSVGCQGFLQRTLQPNRNPHNKDEVFSRVSVA